jgi:hypothetical protein
MTTTLGIPRRVRICRCCDAEVAPGVGRFWSRYVDAYICQACDIRERNEGFWWRDKANADALYIPDRSYVGK